MRVGIIGGGQLGMFLAIYAKKINCSTTILENTPECPGASVCDTFVQGSYDDPVALEKLAQNSDIITYEFENIPHETIAFLENRGSVIPQGYLPLYISQNRKREKESAAKSGLNVAPWFEFSTQDTLAQYKHDLSFPYIIKTASMGYDGKGQWLITQENDIDDFISQMENRQYIAEKKIPFIKELSCIVCRSIQGASVIYGPIENIHDKGILNQSIFPARISDEVQKEARRVAQDYVEKMDFIGIITLELFLLENNKILFNEMAPRPHNSGHLTMDAMNVSQYENALRAIIGIPLISPISHTNALMVNILGQHYPVEKDVIEKSGGIFYDYGKNSTQCNRKVGHITLLGDDILGLMDWGKGFMFKSY